MHVLTDNDPVLRALSAEVVEFDDPLEELAYDMAQTMRAHAGCGLAAVQVGRPIRLLVAEHDGDLRVMVNPIITRRLNRETVEREGCLSVAPSNWRRVSRPAKCDVAWQDCAGRPHSAGFAGRMARIIQHEVDHLDGVLITDKSLS